MSSKHQAQIDAFMDKVKATNGHEAEFLQAVHEVAETVIPFIEEHPKYKEAKILDRIVEPERTIIFRVPWLDDKGEIQVNSGDREIGYMFGQYKRIRNEFTGVLTGKARNWGGSLIRPEATGYGTVYFAKEMLATKDDSFLGKVVAVSGSGNVAQYACEKATQLGAKVVTMSDSSGYIHDAEGISAEKLAFIMELKNVKRGRIEEYVTQFPSAKFIPC